MNSKRRASPRHISWHNRRADQQATDAVRIEALESGPDAMTSVGTINPKTIQLAVASRYPGSLEGDSFVRLPKSPEGIDSSLLFHPVSLSGARSHCAAH